MANDYPESEVVMATLLEIYKAFQEESGLRHRAAGAIMKAAVDVLNEDVGTANHANRVKWANRALADPLAEATLMMPALLGNATIQTSLNNSTDNDIQFVVNGSINAYANALATG